MISLNKLNITGVFSHYTEDEFKSNITNAIIEIKKINNKNMRDTSIYYPRFLSPSFIKEQQRVFVTNDNFIKRNESYYFEPSRKKFINSTLMPSCLELGDICFIDNEKLEFSSLINDFILKNIYYLDGNVINIKKNFLEIKPEMLFIKIPSNIIKRDDLMDETIYINNSEFNIEDKL